VPLLPSILPSSIPSSHRQSSAPASTHHHQVSNTRRRRTHLLVEIGPEGGRRYNSPLIVFLPSLLSRSYFHYSRRGKETRKYLIEQEMKQGNTQQTEDRKSGNCLRCSLLITVCPFHYKGFTIYRRPLGMVICLNYTFSVPNKRL
jgi:hypothetical protein